MTFRFSLSFLFFYLVFLVFWLQVTKHCTICSHDQVWVLAKVCLNILKSLFIGNNDLDHFITIQNSKQSILPQVIWERHIWKLCNCPINEGSVKSQKVCLQWSLVHFSRKAAIVPSHSINCIHKVLWTVPLLRVIILPPWVLWHWPRNSLLTMAELSPSVDLRLSSEMQL